jgi:hypothetical protein
VASPEKGRDMGQSAVNAIVQMLQSNISITMLDLCGNFFVPVFHQQKGNRMGEVGGTKLATALKHNLIIEELNLRSMFCFA